MTRRRALAACVAAGVVVLTVAVDLLRETTIRHERPASVLILAGAIAIALLVLAPRLDSVLVTLGSGLAAGGALATLVTGAAWAGGVPDPLIHGAIAFNVADLAIGAGELLLVGGALAFGWRNRTRLGEPV